MKSLLLAALLSLPTQQQVTEYDVSLYPWDYNYIYVDLVPLDNNITFGVDTDADAFDAYLDLEF